MKTLQQRFSVPFQYPVHFTQQVFAKTNPLLMKVLSPRRTSLPARALVVVDAGLLEAMPALPRQIADYFQSHRTRITLAGNVMVVAGGENAKNGWSSVRELMTRAGQERLDRHSYLVAVGGGSVLDMAGFAAALVHRGLRFVRLPTTVLAQNDAGVGVKNGMNDGGAKNFIGTFSPPYAVINDFAFLKTLSQADWISGVAEAFKVAIISDRPFFQRLCMLAPRLKQRNRMAMQEVVYTTAALHLRHIATSGDPFESGSARPLDFGHWAAHRLELMSNFTLSHGHAVSVGIALDSTYACLKKMISEQECGAILQGLDACGLPICSPLLERRSANGKRELFEGLEQFREHLGGRLCITLPAPVGRKREVHVMDLRLLEQAIGRVMDAQIGVS